MITELFSHHILDENNIIVTAAKSCVQKNLVESRARYMEARYYSSRGTHHSILRGGSTPPTCPSSSWSSSRVSSAAFLSFRQRQPRLLQAFHETSFSLSLSLYFSLWAQTKAHTGWRTHNEKNQRDLPLHQWIYRPCRISYQEAQITRAYSRDSDSRPSPYTPSIQRERHYELNLKTTRDTLHLRLASKTSVC